MAKHMGIREEIIRWDVQTCRGAGKERMWRTKREGRWEKEETWDNRVHRLTGPKGPT